MIFSPMASRREDEENLSSSFLLIDKKEMRELRLKKKPLLILLVATSAFIAVVFCNSPGFRRPISIATTPITATSDAVPHHYNSNTKNDDDIGDDNNKGSVVIPTSTASNSTAILVGLLHILLLLNLLGLIGLGLGLSILFFVLKPPTPVTKRATMISMMTKNQRVDHDTPGTSLIDNSDTSNRSQYGEEDDSFYTGGLNSLDNTDIT